MSQVVSYAVRNMKKDFKYLLGQPLLDLNLQMIICIVKATKAKDTAEKIAWLNNLSENSAEFSLRLRLIKDLKLIDTTKHSKIMLMLASVNTQQHSWLQYLSKKANS